MKSMIIYSSLTGNTKLVAEAIFTVLPRPAEIYPVELAPLADDYDFVVVGFWVDRGTADKKAQNYLQSLRNKKVGLFATLGAYPDSDHARESMVNAASLLDASNQLAGTFICQGKVDPKLIEKFKDLSPGHPHAMTPEREARHREAAKHPNDEDLKKAKLIFTEIIYQMNTSQHKQLSCTLLPI